MAERVLIVEDEMELSAMIRDYLRSRGFLTESVHDGAAAVRAVFENPPSIVVLDLNLPGLSGLDVARTIASQTTVPIIVATARGEEEDRLGGFLAGVDDYLVKPFSLPELALRITAILRRTEAGARPERSDSSGRSTTIRVGELTIDPERREAYVGAQRIRLTAVQFTLVWHLAASAGRVFSRRQLLECVHDEGVEGYERTIDAHVKNIRKQIETDPSRPRRLVTVRGVGYRLEEG